MGMTLAKFFYRKQVRILIVGLNGAGKTAILYTLKLGEVVVTIPTMEKMAPKRKRLLVNIHAYTIFSVRIPLLSEEKHGGFNVETVSYKGVNYVFWDAGGDYKIRPLWRHYVQKTDGIIFVLDSVDRKRITEAKEELWKILDFEEVENAILLVLGNKKDVANSMSIKEITDALELKRLGKRKWHVIRTTVYQSPTLNESLEWLSKEMRSR